jgi:hypothetical protein
VAAKFTALLPLLALVAVSAVSIVFWTAVPQWKTDSLFYEAHVYQVEGDSHAVAYRKVFAGPLSLTRRKEFASKPLAQRNVGNPAWVRFSEQFYERRWFVPALAAAIAPLRGVDALRIASLIAYLLFGPCLYALLRLRAGRTVSFVIAAGALVLAPLIFNAGQPLTDTWGIVLEAVAATAALLALARGRAWLLLWVAALVALSLTRDTTVIVVLPAVWLALRERTRAALALAATGLAASLPAPLLLGAPLRTAMAYTFSGFEPPAHSSWSWVLGQYWPNLHSMVRHNLTYLHGHPLTALFLVGGYLAPFLVRARGDRFVRFIRAAAVASILLDALQPNYTEFRLELSFVPVAAAGLAIAATTGAWHRTRLHTDVLRLRTWTR